MNHHCARFLQSARQVLNLFQRKVTEQNFPDEDQQLRFKAMLLTYAQIDLALPSERN